MIGIPGPGKPTFYCNTMMQHCWWLASLNLENQPYIAMPRSNTALLMTGFFWSPEISTFRHIILQWLEATVACFRFHDLYSLPAVQTKTKWLCFWAFKTSFSLQWADCDACFVLFCFSLQRYMIAREWLAFLDLENRPHIAINDQRPDATVMISDTCGISYRPRVEIVCECRPKSNL